MGPAVDARASVLASVAANTPISARAGWVAWSEPSPGGWRLLAWHSGLTVRLAVAPRPEPFDVNVGTDARGRPVATFSRCTSTPQATAFFNDGPVAPVLGRGCRLRVVDLATGVERAVSVPRPASASDSDPSMWRGRIAFARLDSARHGDVEQVLLWLPSSRRLRTLAHGGMPTGCPPGQSDCATQPRIGTVQGLDLNSRLVTYLWRIQAPGVFGNGNGAWEVRADRLDSGRGVLIGQGGLGEACTGSGTDLAVPSPPVARGTQAWYSELDASCYVFTNVLVRHNPFAQSAVTGRLPPETLQLTRDGGAVFALVAPAPQTQSLPTCAKPAAPCQLERLPTPALRPSHIRPTPPYMSSPRALRQRH